MKKLTKMEKIALDCHNRNYDSEYCGKCAFKSCDSITFKIKLESAVEKSTIKE